MNWLFDGLGTMLLGIVLGAAGDRLVIKIIKNRRIHQSQRAGDNAMQIQAGRDFQAERDSRIGRGDVE